MLFSSKLDNWIVFGKKRVGLETKSTSMTPISNGEKVDAMYSMIREIFPAKSFYPISHSLKRLVNDIAQHHSLLRIFLQEDKQRDNSSRYLRTLCLLTTWTSLLFAVALVFELQHPSNKSVCSSKLSENECLAEETLFDKDQTLCYWYLSHRQNGEDMYSCEYKEVELKAWGSCLMILIISCIVLPVQFVLDYFTNAYIFAPTKKDMNEKPITMNETLVALFGQTRGGKQTGKSVSPSENVDDNYASSIENGTMWTGATIDEGVNEIINAGEENLFSQQEISEIKDSMRVLLSKLKFQRQYVPNEEINSFDDNWKWEPDDGYFRISDKAGDKGWFLQKKRNDIADESPFNVEAGGNIMPFHNVNYLKTEQEIAETLSLSKQLSKALNQSDIEFNEVLLTAFVMDFLGRNNTTGKIFMAREDKICNFKTHVEILYKVCAIVILVAFNVILLWYVVHHNMRRERSYQLGFLFLFLIQVLIEMLYYEAVICSLMYYFIPLTISNEVRKALLVLQRLVTQTFLERTDVVVFNAAKWFFVSSKLAEKVPHLLASQVVLTYHSIYRSTDKSMSSNRQSHLHNFTISSHIIALMQLIGTVPLIYQKKLFYLLLLCGAFVIYAVALLIQWSSWWILLVAVIVLFESLSALKRNSVHVEESESGDEDEETPGDIDDDDLEYHISHSSDDRSCNSSISNNDLHGSGNYSNHINFNLSIDDNSEEKEDDHNIPFGEERSEDYDVNDVMASFNASIDRIIGKANDRKVPIQDDNHQKESQQRQARDVDITSESAVMEPKSNRRALIHGSNPVLTFSPSIASTSLLSAKKGITQPPKKISVDNMFDLSSDSSSDDNESVGQLNVIFDRFLSTDRQDKIRYDRDDWHGGDISNDRKELADFDRDDDSAEDYDKLMTQFNFRTMESSGSDNDKSDSSEEIVKFSFMSMTMNVRA